MASISNIVDVSITIQDSAPTVRNFGIPLIMAYHTKWLPELVKTFSADNSGLAELQNVWGFGATDPVYRMASAICSQKPHCSTFKVGRRRSPISPMFTCAPTGTTGPAGCKITFDGVEHTISATGSSKAAIVDKLVTQVANLAHDELTATPIGTPHESLLVACEPEHTMTWDTAVAAVLTDATIGVHTLQLTPTRTTVGFVYTLDISVGGADPVTVTYEVQLGDTVEDICDGIVAAVVAETELADVTATDATTHITLSPTAEDETRILLRNVSRELTILDDTSDATGLATDITAAANADTDWYGLLLEATSVASIGAAFDSCETLGVLLGSLSPDSAIFDSTSETDIAYALDASGHHQGYLIATRDMFGFGHCCLMARQFSKDPGTSTWAMKTLTGPIADALTGGEHTAAEQKHACTYENTAGISHTYFGWAPSGRFIDITHGIAWMKARLEEAVWGRICSVEKIDYTDAGIALIESEVRGVLQLAESRKILTPGWTVTPPLAGEQTLANKANRYLPDFKFSGTLGGAIHRVTIAGTISV